MALLQMSALLLPSTMIGSTAWGYMLGDEDFAKGLSRFMDARHSGLPCLAVRSVCPSR